MSRRMMALGVVACLVLALSGCGKIRGDRTDFAGTLNVTGDCPWIGDDMASGISLDLSGSYELDGVTIVLPGGAPIASSGDYVVGTGQNLDGSSGCLDSPQSTEVIVLRLESPGK